MKSIASVNLDEIQKARDFLSPLLPNTPLIHSPGLSALYHCEIFLKLETLQPIGSFKIRGATYKISNLSKAVLRKGVVASSAGNHAQGVAWGARELGGKARIFMPRNAALVKVQSTRALGAEIVLEGDNFDEAWVAAHRFARKHKRTFVHAYEDPYIVAGQGTLGLEILEQIEKPDFVVGSVGGGGMMAGVGIALKALSPETQLVAAQAQYPSAMVHALRSGSFKKMEVRTFADGVAISSASKAMYGVLKKVIDRAIALPDEATAHALLVLLERGKMLVEGSGALPLAAVDAMRSRLRGKKVVLILSGGNIDLTLLGRMIERGLITAGRRLRLNVKISDRPGSLHRLTGVIAEAGANIIQAIHDRSEPFTKMDETGVELTLETKGADHSKKIIQDLTRHCLRVQVFDR